MRDGAGTGWVLGCLKKTPDPFHEPPSTSPLLTPETSAYSLGIETPAGRNSTSRSFETGFPAVLRPLATS